MRSLFVVGVVLLVLLALPGAAVFVADLLGYGADLNQWTEAHLGVSHRLALGLPAAVVLACAPPLIVLLYFLRLKRKPLPVSSTYLWKKSVEDLHVNRLMQWLRRNVLLLLQLLAVILVLYAVLGPRTRGAVFGGRHYIILIDNSASMSATDVAPSRLEWAKGEAIKTIDAATDADPGMLIVFNATAEIRQSYTTNREELKAAVRGVKPTQYQTRIDEALALAASRANPNRSTENAAVSPANPEPGKERQYVNNDGFQADVFLLSDGRFPPVPDFALQNLSVRYPEMPLKADGGTSDNVAVVRFDAERDPDDPRKVRAYAEIANYRGEPVAATVRLAVRGPDRKLVRDYKQDVTVPKKEPPPPTKPGEPLDKQPPETPPGKRPVVFELPDVAETEDAVLELTVEHGGDALPLDDSAWLVLGVVRKAKVLVVTPGNRVLRTFFDTAAAKRLGDFTYIAPADLTDPKAYLGPARDGLFDLVVFDRCGPAAEEQMPAANTFFVGYPPPQYALTPAGGTPNGNNATTPEKGPTVRGRNRDHPLMRNLGPLDEVRVSDAFRLPFLPPRTPRLIEGDRDLVLLAAVARQSFTDLVLAFPLVVANADGPDRVWNTEWPLQPSFVLFLRNVLTQLGNVRDAGADELLRPGQPTPLRPNTAKEVFVTKPGQDTGTKYERGTRTEVVYADTDTLGVYEAAWAGQSRRFAVNLLDADESNIAPVPQFAIGTVTVTAGEGQRQPIEWWKGVVVAGLVVVLAEWWIYNRRVQI